MALGAAAALGVTGVTALAGCGSSSSAGSTGSTAAAGTSAAGGSASAGAAAGGSGGALAKLSDVPVGQSFSAAGPDGKPIVISQPTAGQVVAFSAKCTHQGCTVLPQDKTLMCPCHGSTFDPATGKNLGGPAPSPLNPIAVKLSGTDIVAG
jgi:Rieske Fe-S protein